MELVNLSINFILLFEEQSYTLPKKCGVLHTLLVMGQYSFHRAVEQFFVGYRHPIVGFPS